VAALHAGPAALIFASAAAATASIRIISSLESPADHPSTLHVTRSRDILGLKHIDDVAGAGIQL
jgi:hypothetical protein